MYFVFMCLIPILAFISMTLLIIYLIKLIFFEKKVIIKVYKEEKKELSENAKRFVKDIVEGKI